jgi:phytoene synthase
MADPFAACEGLVRRADPDRYFSALFAPAPVRPFMLGAIRLEWWRETLEGAGQGAPRNHDVARGLALLFAQTPLTPAGLQALVAARAFDSSADRLPNLVALENYVDATGGALMRLAIALLGGDEIFAREAGLAYGLTGLLRSLPFHNARHKLYMPVDLIAATNLTPEEFFVLKNDDRQGAVVQQLALRARDHWLAAHSGPRPGRALAALLPAALVPLYLRKLSSGRDVPIHRRQMALLSAAMRKRL